MRLFGLLLLSTACRSVPKTSGTFGTASTDDEDPTHVGTTPTTETTPTGTPPTSTTPGTTTPTETTTETTETTPAVVRVVTWNVETLGERGSDEYDAVLSVLARINADVVALNEIDYGEEVDVEDLAADLGYTTVVVAYTNPFGGLHNAIMTRLPVASSTLWTSEDLSGDPDANDVTRLPVAVEVEVGIYTLAVVSEHWKSGFEIIDEFRRVMDSVRVGQAVEAASTDAVIALGDMNAEIGESTVVPTWYYLPDNAPSSYELGTDLQDALDGAGIADDAFLPLTDAGLVKVDAAQRDGNLATRDVSGRIIDHLYADPSLTVLGAEVYDARDDALPGLVLSGTAPDVGATEAASDHFPVFVDLQLGL